MRWTAVFFALLVLYSISTVQFLLFYGIVELVGLAVAFSIFIIVWNTRRVIPDTFFLITGISFLFFGIIDLLHMLAFAGIGFSPGDNPDLPGQLWIAARLFQGMTFLIATFFIGRSITDYRKYDVGLILATCTLACSLMLGSILVWQDFPRTFSEGGGLTPFAIASGYVIPLVLVVTIAVLWRKRNSFDPAVWRLLVAAQVFSLMSAVSLSSYGPVISFANVATNLFRIVSIYLFYLVFIVIGLNRPYDLLLRDLKINEDRLRESEGKWRSLFENMLEGLAYCRMIYDDEGRPVDWLYLDVNKAFEELTGLKDTTGRRVLEILPDIRTLNPELFDTYGTVASTGKPATFETDFKPLKMWLNVSVFSPQQGYFVAVFEDITERKRVEEEVRRARDFYLKILDDFPNPVWRADTRGRTDYFNQGWLEFTGREFEEEQGEGWTSGIHPDDRKICLQTRAEHFLSRTPFSLEYRLLHHDGTYHWLIDSGKPFTTAEGEFAGFIGSCYDIHGRRQAEEALQLANAKLNLLSSITRHDINNQLVALKAYLELSKEHIGDAATISEYIIRMERASNAIERQIVFTKEYQELGVKAPVWQNVETCIRDAIASLPMRDILIELQPGDLEIFGDPLLARVFYNLIDNALRYGGSTMTAIRITWHETVAGMVVVVEDNGVGITAEDKKRLFTKGFGHHSGLGLFLSREILSITGITITENGEPGRGARFEITVPPGGYRLTA